MFAAYPLVRNLQRLVDALRRAGQPLALGILAELHQQLPDQVLHRPILYLDRGRSGRGPERRRALCRSRQPRERSARASSLWADALKQDPRDFDAAWKLARVSLLARRPRPGEGATRASRAGHGGGAHRRWRSSRRGPRATSGWRPTWARSPNRSACATGFGIAAPVKDELETVLKLDPGVHERIGRSCARAAGTFACRGCSAAATSAPRSTSARR